MTPSATHKKVLRLFEAPDVPAGEKMVKYRFRLVGVPPDQAFQWIEIDTPDQRVESIKKLVRFAFHLHPERKLTLHLKGTILDDDTRFLDAGIDPAKDHVTVEAWKTRSCFDHDEVPGCSS